MSNHPEVPRTRRGRPPATEAGVVEARILDTATSLFLEQGFGRTTLDRVSQLSRTGKSAVYGRYRDKEALFAAVARRSIDAMFDDMAALPPGGSVRDRLRHVGLELAKNLLVPRCVSLMRITAAEAVNFPDLAKMAYGVSFEGSVRRVVDALDADRTGKASTPSIRRIAERFIELTLQPISFQAAYGAEVEDLRQRCASDVEDALVLLDAKGWLRD